MSPTSATAAPPCLIGIDVGTSSIKAAAFTLEGDLVALRRAITPVTSHADGRIENDAAAVWSVVAELVQSLVHDLGGKGSPAAVAVASVGESGLPVDADGRHLGPLIAWNDARSAQQAQWWQAAVGRDRIHQVSGQTLDPHYGVNKLLWLRDHQPEVFARTRQWLSMADWIVSQLSGEQVTDVTLASRTMVFDQARRTWSADLLAEAGLDESLFPPVVESGTQVGVVSAAAARLTGLPTGLPVVSGGHDRLCGSFAVRGGSGAVIDSTGSAEALVLPTGEYVARGEEEAGYVSCYADVVPGRYVYSARVGYAGTLLDWLGTVAAPGGNGVPDLVAEIPQPLRFSGLLAFPSFGRVVTPFWDDDAAAGALAGLRLSHTRGHLAQALIEAVTYSLRANLTWLEELSGTRSEELRVEGGVTRIPAWMQLKADITGREIHAVTLDEPTALGAALLAGVGAGLFSSHAEATRDLAVPLETWVPDPARQAVYERVFTEGYLSFAASQGRINALLRDVTDPR